MARIEFTGVAKTYPDGSRAVTDLNLVIEDNEFLCLLGPSGCGKSSTIRMLAGLEAVTSGTIELDGRRLNEVPPQRRDAAMVFENYALYPHLSVFRNLAMPLRAQRVRQSEITERVETVAALLRISDLLHMRPGRLSGGEKQRVGIGRAIIRRPTMFLMDEPLGHLEAYLRIEFRAEIRRLHDQLGVTTVYVTHDQAEAAAIADRIAVMWQGRLQQVGAIEDLLDRPRNRFLAEFIGELPMNFFSASIVSEGGAPALALGGAVLAPAPAHAAALGAQGVRKIDFGIRPEDVTLTSASGAHGLAGRAVVVEPRGETTIVIVDSAAARLRCLVPSEQAPEPGAAVIVGFDMERAHLFDAEGRNLLNGGRG